LDWSDSLAADKPAVDKQVTQLSQRDHAAGYYGGRKWHLFVNSNIANSN